MGMADDRSHVAAGSGTCPERAELLRKCPATRSGPPPSRDDRGLYADESEKAKPVDSVWARAAVTASFLLAPGGHPCRQHILDPTLGVTTSSAPGRPSANRGQRGTLSSGMVRSDARRPTTVRLSISEFPPAAGNGVFGAEHALSFISAETTSGTRQVATR